MSHDLTADRIALANIRRAAMYDSALAEQQAADAYAAQNIANAESAAKAAEEAAAHAAAITAAAATR